MIVTKDVAFTNYRAWMEDRGHYTDEVLDLLIESMRADVGNAKANGGGRWRPSLIGDPCDRKQVLSHSGERSAFSGNWYTWAGTWLHLGFQAFLLDKWGPDLLSIETTIAPEEEMYGVTGKADWVWHGDTIWDGMTQLVGPHIGDYKTTSSMKKISVAPDPKHVDQLGTEMVTVGIRTAYLVYQYRGHGDMVTWRLEVEAADERAYIDRLERLESHRKADTLPEMLAVCQSMSGSTYDRCDFKEACLKHALKGQ